MKTYSLFSYLQNTGIAGANEKIASFSGAFWNYN